MLFRFKLMVGKKIIRLSEEERLSAVHMLQAGQNQEHVADVVVTSQSVISRLWAIYRTQ